ncbi:hypothetical protein BB561_003141 [Smittium simulii]|uniref:chitin synthase n=1 Tax=Smittium simulii TaxID=133385 RepID=A0A2T9YMW2_9FUNG|nr:hypothetical protein BB561_003141 [Smittium simulii]
MNNNYNTNSQKFSDNQPPYTNYLNLANSSTSLGNSYKQGVGFSPPSSETPQEKPTRRYNTGTIKKKIVETDKNGYLSLDLKPVDKTSTTRTVWLVMVWLFTFLVPDFFIGWLGKKTKEEKIAWREKVTLCILIFFSWAVLLFVIIGLGLILCPKQHVWSMAELSGHNSDTDAFISLRGVVYDITGFINQKHGAPFNPDKSQMITYAGYEVNSSFPLTVSTACPGLIDPSLDPNNNFYLQSPPLESEFVPQFYHRVGSVANSEQLSDQDFYTKYVLTRLKSMRKGELVWTKELVNDYYQREHAYWRIINGQVFNLGDYFYNSQGPLNTNSKKYNFLNSEIEKLFDDGGVGNVDISVEFNALNIDGNTKAMNMKCLQNLFYSGSVDTRKSFKCLFTNYLLLGFACILVFVILIKFLASLQFGTKKLPPLPKKFVLSVVPCYTEGLESISRTINSLAALDYNDTRKLIFVICDGNIVGTGNDRPTPRIVLDMLGVDPDYDPPARDCLAIAEDSLEHNRAKVYSGLYDFEGHSVPFIVVVKVGNLYELKRPGNRGKRDSQLLIMRFLAKAHFELPMTPLELDIYHHFNNIIGIDPLLYEFMLQIDADTVVHEDSLRRLVSYCSTDVSIVGICGETCLSNEQESLVTMMQVYEYFISHHMSKAFESLFGSVTCLPGCFCMYRIFDKTGDPVLISPKIIVPYSEKHVDTLHKKNLLSLGEDRYLTTLMLNHFPKKKLKFARDAKCSTIAPNQFKVFISQRRRWINSTVHNLFELMTVKGLCGLCCFSMRFVVFLDLFGTLTMPTLLLYFAYLIFISITKFADTGIISIIIIAAVYGLQAIIYILRREWQHIGWMLLYLLFFPFWSFFLPIYSFWHFDEFSWGDTRKAVGDKNENLKGDSSDQDKDYKFDSDSIPLMLWNEYQGVLASQGALNQIPENPSRISNRAASQMSGIIVNRPATAFSRLGQQNTNSRLDYNSGVNSLIMNNMPPRAMSTTFDQPSLQMQYSNINQQQMPTPMQIQNINMLNQASRRNTALSMSNPQVYPQMPAAQNKYPQSNRSSQFMGYQTPQGIPMDQQQYMMQNLQQIDSQILAQNSANFQGSPQQFANRSVTPEVMSIAQQHQSMMFQDMTSNGIKDPRYPSEDQIYEAIIQILSTSDLNKISKKKLRDQLSFKFGVDMEPYKITINSFIDQALEQKTQ